MIKSLKINNFKSVRNLELDCKRVNVFIGEPNKGKTNILEAIALASPSTAEHFKEIFRFSVVSDLFTDMDISKRIELEIDNDLCTFSYRADKSNFEFNLYSKPKTNVSKASYKVNHAGIWTMNSLTAGLSSDILYYKFKSLDEFKSKIPGEKLMPPYGDNLPALVYSNPKLKKVVSDFFRENGYRLSLDPVKNEIMLAKEVGEEIYNFAYPVVSETFRRIVFMMLAIESNKYSTILFDEPEAHTFPFYTKYLAERLALDNSNQYFLTTHNSYLLHSIVEKTPTDELLVGIVYMENYETKVHILTPDQLSELSDTDIFYNLEFFLEA